MELFAQTRFKFKKNANNELKKSEKNGEEAKAKSPVTRKKRRIIAAFHVLRAPPSLLSLRETAARKEGYGRMRPRVRFVLGLYEIRRVFS